jgi:hypothetical protein
MFQFASLFANAGILPGDTGVVSVNGMVVYWTHGLSLKARGQDCEDALAEAMHVTDAMHVANTCLASAEEAREMRSLPHEELAS